MAPVLFPFIFLGVAMTTSRTADTIFSGKGTDEVLAADVYQVKDKSTLNKIYDSIKGKAAEAAEYAKSNPYEVSNVLRTASDLKSGVITKEQALDRIGYGLNSGTLLKLASKAGPTLEKIATKIGVHPELIGQFKYSFGESVRYIESGDGYDSYGSQSHFEIARELLGNPELMRAVDLESEAATLSGLFDDAVRYGFYDLFEYVKQQNQYDRVSFSVAVMSASSMAVFGGDIAAVEEILKHISVEEFLGENPDAIKSILSTYRLSYKTTPDQYPAKLAQLTGVLTRLNAHWYETTLHGTWVIDYDVMSTISADAKTLFLTDDVLRPLVLVAPFYRAQSPITLGAQMYPNSAIGVFS